MKIMKMFTEILLSAVLVAVTLHAAAETSAQPMQDRWFYVCRSLDSDREVAELLPLIETASRAGLNGMLFACGVEYYADWSLEKKERLQTVRRFCEAQGVEIIPIIWSIGYGVMLDRDPNLSAGVPVCGVPYLVKGKEAAVIVQSCLDIPNGDFEEHDGDEFPFQGWIDQPGVVSFADTEVKHGGNCSIRLENFASDSDGHGRICIEAKLKPHFIYRLSCHVRTEGFAINPRDSFKLQFYDRNGMQSCAWPAVVDAQDWTKVSMVFYTGESSEGDIYVGVWDGKGGKVWIDDLKLEPVGVNQPLRRPGTPFVVRNALDRRVYVEGEDYEPISPLEGFAEVPSWRIWENADAFPTSLVLKLTDHSAIEDGDRLLIDYYFPPRSWRQHTTCMSEPMLYDMLEASARDVAEALHPRKWFLSMDEIRAGGTCAACQARHTDMAHILADCIRRQQEMIKAVCPEAEIYIWSDMLDPAHNAHDGYFRCRGTFEGVWNLIPKELVIACWGKGRESMPFFSAQGFRTLGAAYYDADTLDGCRDWLRTCRQTPHCSGIMYTSWQNKYELLEAFGKMVNGCD